jgi:hypothetical protein
MIISLIPPGFVYIEDNLFVNNQGFIINNYASYGLSKTIVNNNSFTGTEGIILEVEKRLNHRRHGCIPKLLGHQ